MEKLYSVALMALKLGPSSVLAEIRSWFTSAGSLAEANGRGLIEARRLWPGEDWNFRVSSSEIPEDLLSP
jgi:hypothetical protein